jgi:hypothetical protein
MDGADETDDKNKDELILDLVKRRYDDELQRGKDLDGKAGSLIGYVTIVTGLLVGLGTFDILGKLSKPEYYIPYFTGIGLLLSSIISSMMAIKLTKFVVAPEFAPLLSVLNDSEYKYRTVIRRVFLGFGCAISSNIEKNENKVKWTNISWICLITGLVLILIYVVIFTTSGNLKG